MLAHRECCHLGNDTKTPIPGAGISTARHALQPPRKAPPQLRHKRADVTAQPGPAILNSRTQLAGIVGFGFAMCLSSGLGQTFFISLFNDSLRAEFSLSHGDIGTLYFAGTLASAATVFWLGKLVDSIDLRFYTAFVTIGLGIAAAVMANVNGPVMLACAFYLLRLFGQGLSGHTGITTVSRLPAGRRGRAVSISGLGFSTAEAILPWLIVPLVVAVGWRNVWWLCAAIALVLTTSLTQLLLHIFPIAQQARGASREDKQTDAHSWTRAQVVRDSRFWQMAPALFAPSIISTALFFHQQSLASWKGFPFSFWAANIAAYSLCAVVTSVIAGHLVDRHGAAPIVRLYLLPFCASLLIAGWSDLVALPALYYGAMGITVGIAVPAVSALWLELYGPVHLGSIRALTHALMVFGSALGPPLYGILLDNQIGWQQILTGSTIWMLLATILLWRVNLGQVPAQA